MTPVERRDRTAAVLAKFRDKPFSWEGANCLRLAREQMLAMGHAPPPIPVFRSAMGAQRALRRRGFETLEALLDSMLARIPPAAAWLGDLVMLPGHEGQSFGALFIAGGDGILRGWHDSDPGGLRNVVQAEHHAIGAWRL